MLRQCGKLVLLFCAMAVGAMPQGQTTTGGTNAVAQLTKQQRCSLPPVEPSNISCFAFIPSWTFNSATGVCDSFVYGGCGGTANLFETLAQCNAICGPEPTGPVITATVCLQQKVVGPCRASIPSFFFDFTTRLCTPFNYGGCNGNDNRFASERACRLACSRSDFDSEENH
ncbi:BPTI/Kunitz domain-containing protein-like [Daphnia carinata]|uniref:BPTI/Kunitz domain-containing protein-like n=1 Tax=Daphnia carinata TaxID=120202 RepID=UPI00257E0B41|nr:BPTI/Kunitz domain-containing protein-like [Daphnia carinata]